MTGSRKLAAEPLMLWVIVGLIQVPDGARLVRPGAVGAHSHDANARVRRAAVVDLIGIIFQDLLDAYLREVAVAKTVAEER